jgi:hypothetical protein
MGYGFTREIEEVSTWLRRQIEHIGLPRVVQVIDLSIPQSETLEAFVARSFDLVAAQCVVRASRDSEDLTVWIRAPDDLRKRILRLNRDMRIHWADIDEELAWNCLRCERDYGRRASRGHHEDELREFIASLRSESGAKFERRTLRRAKRYIYAYGLEMHLIGDRVPIPVAPPA